MKPFHSAPGAATIPAMPSEIGTALVIRADARHLPLADDSVDLIVTSPPFFALRSYQDGGQHYAGQVGDEPTPQDFVDSLIEVTRECLRVMKPSGSLWVNLGDKYAGTRMDGSNDNGTGTTGLSGGVSVRDREAAQQRPRVTTTVTRKSLIGIPWRYALRCIDDLGLILRAEVIWEKPNAMPQSATDRVGRSHETWFHFVREPHYFAAADPQRPRSVWSIPTEPLRIRADLEVDHFAAFPTSWPERIIRGWCPEGGTTLDVFGGTGTTALVAKAMGRHGVSVDLSRDYCRVAEWRTTDISQIDRVRCRVAMGKSRPGKREREIYETFYGDITPGIELF